MDSPINQPPQEAKLHFLDYWRIIRLRKAIIITVFLITSIVAVLVTFIMQPQYSSTAEIRIEPDTTGDISGMGDQTTIAPQYDPYFLETELKILQGPLILDKVINSLNLNTVWAKKYGMDSLKTSETMEILNHQLTLVPVRNTTLVDITFDSPDKREAANVANAIAQSYREYRLDRYKTNTSGGIEALQEIFQSEEEKIQAVSTNVYNLRKQLAIVDTDPNSLVPTPTLSQQRLEELHNMMLEGENRYVRLKEQLDKLKALSPEQLRDVLPTTINQQDSELSTLLSKLHEAQQTYVTKTNYYGAGSSDIASIQSLIAELNQQIDDRINGAMITLENNVDTEKAALDAMNAEVETAKIKDQEEAARGQPYWDAKRKLVNMENNNAILQAKITQEIADLAIPRTSMVEITSPAEPGKDPVKPDKKLIISLGLIFGLLMGIGLAFFIEYLDTSVKTIDDVERLFQAPVLGVIPQNVGVLIDEGLENPYAEAYRILRTNILFARKDKKLSAIVIVSAGAGEGKSTTTLNLATVFAQAGQRVLVVDSDLRRPTLHKLLHVGNDLGLTNYLLNQNQLEEVVQTTSVPMLHFMASGKLPSSSMSILNSEQMKRMIEQLKQRYDFVLFDSPPILGVSDASILASEVDMVVQVIQYRRYPQPMTLRAKQVIEKVGGTFIGIVLNNINMSQDESYYYYSGYYHDYYYSGSPKDQEAAASKNSGVADRTGIKQKY